MNEDGFGYWLALAAFFIALVLLTRPAISGALLAWVSSWASERFTPVEEYDPIADDLYQALRRERLRADLARLERLVATDENMSATRQLGNRLAYAWLLRERERLGGLRDAPPSPAAAYHRDAGSTSAHTAGQSYTSQRGSNVEVLELGWRR